MHDGTTPPAPTRVLVVDDNVDAAETYAALIAMWGHTAACAHDGPAGLAAAEAFRPDVIVLDIGLPGLDGYEVAAALRRNPLFRTALIVAVTGHGREDDRRFATDAGIDHYFLKPVAPETLRLLIANAGPRA